MMECVMLSKHISVTTLSSQSPLTSCPPGSGLVNTLVVDDIAVCKRYKKACECRLLLFDV